MIELSQKQKDGLKKIAEKYELKLLVLFGSSATGKTHKESDVDVAYLAEKNLELGDEARLIIELVPALKSKLVDLVNIHLAPPLLLYAITDHGQVLYQTNPLSFYELRAYAFKRYVEAKPLFELKEQRLKEYVQSIR